MIADPSRRARFLSRLPFGVRRRIAFLLVANAAILGFILWRSAGTKSSFADEALRIVPNVAPIALAGLGLTGIIWAGAIDLSIGSILAVAGTVFALLQDRDVGPGRCALACFLAALGLSVFNGLLVRWLRVSAIIVTLAGLSFYRGAALILADAGARGFSEQFTLDRPSYHALGRDHSGWVLTAGLAAALLWEWCGKTPRLWLAAGNSPTACRLSGFSCERIVLGAYLAGGVFLGLAAVLDVTNHITIEPARLGEGFELSVIAAVVLGGTSIFGGQGSYLGTALGALFLYLIGPAMLYAGINEYWRTTLQGGVILAVIGVDCLLGRKRKLLEELR